MVFSQYDKPKDMNTLGLLGYLIVANKQIHSFQLDALSEYLTALGLTISDTVIGAVIDGHNSPVSYASSISAYALENETVKREIFYILTVLALVDNSIDENEEIVIEDVFTQSGLSREARDTVQESAKEAASAIRNDNNLPFIRKKPNIEHNKNWLQRIIHWIKAFFQRLFGIQPEKVQNPEIGRYKEAIDNCAVIAREDYASLSPVYSQILNSCNRTISEIKAFKRGLSLETGPSADVAKVIDSFIGILHNEVLTQCELAQLSLNQKKRTVSDFTISLLGRTKAGKSTLHSILTNQGKDQIGTGAQRTTRYNRVFQWNYLRIIDTPGIGSSESDGRTDEEIARSVLGESDIICFVIADDSILQDILEFITKIAELNKPIIILLNHKDNIRPDVRFNRFLNNPREWIETTGESNLLGFVNRIQKYADDNGFGRLIRIHPIFLLPALMSTEDHYSQYSNLLWESSNIDSFIEQLKSWIINCGTIKRSQTILDEAVHLFDSSINRINIGEYFLNEQKEKLIKQRGEKIHSLKETEKTVIESVKETLKEKYDKLAKQDALIFAEEEYDSKGNLSEKWKLFLQRINFENDINQEINKDIRQYAERAADITVTLFEDLFYSVKMSLNELEIDVPLQFDFKTATRLLGGITSTIGNIIVCVLGGTSPVGWILSIVGTAIGFGSLLFSTKEQKRQKAINKLYNAIKNHIEENSSEAIENICKTIQQNMSDHTATIDRLFLDLQDGICRIITITERLRKEYITQNEYLNQLFALRLIQFISKNDGLNRNFNLNDVISVDRSCPGTINIQLLSESEYTTSFALEGIIAETVSIEGRNAR